MDRIITVAKEAGIYVGMGGDPAFGSEMAARGVDWIQVGSDFEYMVQGMDEIMATVRG